METVIFQKVKDYLTDYVGELTMPGAPVFDAATRCWRVPVLCKTAKGILPVGEFVADVAGNFVAVPDKEQMLRVLRAQVVRLPFLVFGEKEELERMGVHVVAA
ncbi:MAG: hypothetical protein GW893_14670 [Armatimonadetes bacterium]|nr:hypothetical protein [Armatimonadota bacterium]PIU61960.1 MAG: hypothetical protein COS85_19895 [Armatimonadetes bacterium CG07_land_8_20_14_0_80_59_28]